jgi:hypothetical protein
MLGDLEQGVTTSDQKLSSAMKRMRKFIRDTEGKSITVQTRLWETHTDLVQRPSPVGV